MKRLVGALITKMSSSLFFATFVLISGCSFHSNQLEAVKRLLKPTEVVAQERWFLSGPVNDRRVYPVQARDSIIFTDGEAIFLKFDGRHFTEIRGLAIDLSGKISESSLAVSFRFLGTFSSVKVLKMKIWLRKCQCLPRVAKNCLRVRYDAWQKCLLLTEALSQSCSFKSQEAFSNNIWLDHLVIFGRSSQFLAHKVLKFVSRWAISY